MAEPIMTFATRRTIGLTAAAVLMLAAALIVHLWDLTLRWPAHLSGWTLLALIGVLTSYNIRKKLPYPPLLSNAVWLQIHIYLGLTALAVFVLHTGPGLPRGVFEIILYALFLGVGLSGIIGLALSRAIPPRLTIRGQEVIFERIPTYRRELRERAEDLIERTVQEHETTTLADFYRRRLLEFFAGPRHALRHLLQSRGPLTRLREELRALHRYMDEQERESARELEELIEAKDDLDYHAAMQRLLKSWLFVHVPLTYAMLVCAVLHVALVYSY
jgi:cytochrome b561